MKTIKALLPVAAILGLAAGDAFAGALVGITSVTYSGPGGTGVTPVMSGMLVEPALTYTSVNFIDMTITVDEAGSYLINEAPGFGGVHNSTGQTWTAFDLSVQPGSTGAFSNDWFDGSSSFATVSSLPLDVHFSNGTIPDGGNVEPVGHYTTTGPGTFTIRETPIVPAPEPSSLALVALGVFGMGFARRRVA